MSQAEIYRRLSRIERAPCVLEDLLGPLAAGAGRSVAAIIADQADAIYRDALGGQFTRLELAAIRCRCNVARLAIIPARPGSPLAVSIASERRLLAQIEQAIARSDAELTRWIMAKLKARGWPWWSGTRPDMETSC